MAIFDTLIDDVASQFGLGSNAGPFVREILSMITGTPGGVGGFLNNMKAAGLSSEVASWMGHANAAPLAGSMVDRALGFDGADREQDGQKCKPRRHRKLMPTFIHADRVMRLAGANGIVFSEAVAEGNDDDRLRLSAKPPPC